MLGEITVVNRVRAKPEVAGGRVKPIWLIRLRNREERQFFPVSDIAKPQVTAG